MTIKFNDLIKGISKGFWHIEEIFKGGSGNKKKRDTIMNKIGDSIIFNMFPLLSDGVKPLETCSC